MNYRNQVEALLDDWFNSSNGKQSKNIINCLVEFLTEDTYWLNQNISVVDREAFIAAAKNLQQGAN